MLTEYVQKVMKRAKYEILPGDGSYYGSIKGFPGLYANAPSLEKCREELLETLEEWILIRLRKNLKVPLVHRIDLNIKKVA